MSYFKYVFVLKLCMMHMLVLATMFRKKITLSFTYPLTVPNLYEFVKAIEHKSYCEECW